MIYAPVLKVSRLHQLDYLARHFTHFQFQGQRILKSFIKTLFYTSQMPSVEPFVMDSLSLALTGGPNGYKINLKDMEVYGASNFTVRSIT